jgi:hypothetical protein
VKVVGGSEIYNFPIDRFVHFYSTFGVFLFQTGPLGLTVVAPRRPDGETRDAPTRDGLRGAANLGVRARVVPRTRAPRRIGVRPRRVSCPHSSTGRPHRVHWSVRGFSLRPHACRGRPCPGDLMTRGLARRRLGVVPHLPVAYKGPVALHLDATVLPTLSRAARRCHWGQPRRAPGSGRPRAQSNPPPPPLAPPGAAQAVHSRAPTESTPALAVRWQVPTGAAPPPYSVPNRALVSSYTFPKTSSAETPAGAAGFRRAAAPIGPRDPIAWPSFCLRRFV